MSDQKKNRIELKNIYKSFGGVHALQDVSLNVKEGEIHALVGQNGAGKSTLMKILSGAYKKDKGEIFINGKQFSGNNLIEIRKAGLGIIYQEFALAPDLTVAENIFINRMSLGRKRINWKELYRQAQEILNRLGFDIDAYAKVGELRVAYQQVVEIAKTLSEDVNVLILDEPTAVLSPKETENLFALLRKLKDQGVSIIYISHRLDEIFLLSDEITIMRDGRVVNSVRTQNITMNQVIEQMIGQSYESMFSKRDIKLGAPVLEVSNVCNGIHVQNVSFKVHAGEILGIAGLVGAGKTELARAIFGADKNCTGEIRLNGRPVKVRSPYEAIRLGIAYLPESRKEHGVLLSQSVRINTTMASLKKVRGPFDVVRQKKEKQDTREMISKLHIKTDGTEIHVGGLSGGNQQKVSLAKWLYGDNKVIILDEPTRGVDIGAKMEIYNLINDLTKEGLAVVLISSEVEEIIGMSDRVLILNKGRAMGILEKEDISQTRIINYSVGVVNE
ncbi:MAG: sugar ABC transporter ATP-binding protein [Lachnospiraceae bacterium]|nr:sugar ABC transporter ATP-binding protein [Lachnospiraceae bacterium]